MLTYHTGPEPHQKVLINPSHVMYAKPSDSNFTWIYMRDGKKFLVDAKFEDVVEDLGENKP